MKRVDHRDLFKDLSERCQCSRRSFLELLYGHSYQDRLGKLREQVRDYPVKVSVNKKQTVNREATLELLAIEMNKPLARTTQVTHKKTVHAEKGALEIMCVNLFCRAYGLCGFQKEDHRELYKEAIEKSQCSRRAFLECLYGHSYNQILGVLRQQVLNYPEKIHHKKTPERALMLENLSVIMNNADKVVRQSTPLRASAPIYNPAH